MTDANNEHLSLEVEEVLRSFTSDKVSLPLFQNVQLQVKILDLKCCVSKISSALLA